MVVYDVSPRASIPGQNRNHPEQERTRSRPGAGGNQEANQEAIDANELGGLIETHIRWDIRMHLGEAMHSVVCVVLSVRQVPAQEPD